MENIEERIQLQKDLLQSFKEGVKSTFLEEISNHIKLTQIFHQSSNFILQYGIFKIITLITL